MRPPKDGSRIPFSPISHWFLTNERAAENINGHDSVLLDMNHVAIYSRLVDSATVCIPQGPLGMPDGRETAFDDGTCGGIVCGWNAASELAEKPVL